MGSGFTPDRKNCLLMRKFSETLSSIIASSGLNLNQICKVLGISNACLTKIEILA
jgi:hypothetical protein